MDPAGLNALLASLGHDPFGRPEILTRGLGVAITTFHYYPTGWPLILAHNLSGGAAPDLVLGFSYNRAGGISQAFRDNDLYAWQGHYQVSRNYTANGLNQYTAAGTASFGYDGNGNLTSDGASTFTYDVENRLVGRSGGVTLRYDPLGRLHRVAGPSSDTSFLYDGDALTLEYNASGTVLRRYVHGSNAGADDPLIWYEGLDFNLQRHLFADERGSIVAVADANGNLTTVHRYDEYGIPASTNAGRFQYTGQIWLPELGMYYYKSRMYSPTLGRFPQTDTIGYEGGTNLYAYVDNDPVNQTDPSGESPLDAVQEVLDWVGFTPAGVIADPINAGISALRGDWRGAGERLVGAVPIVGDAIRGVDKARDVARAADRVGEAVRGARSRGRPDFVVDSRGVASRPNVSGARRDLEQAGYPGRPTTQTGERGTTHRVGNTDVRIMNGSNRHPPRAVTNRAGTNDPVQQNGRQFPNGTPRSTRRDGSHRTLDPD